MAWADINGIRLYYESHGEGEVIVFAHGSGGNHLSWYQQVAHFWDRYRCITFDHRGFGQSVDVEDGPGDSAYPDDLRALLDHLGVERAFLVAQSMGGRTCMGLVADAPERVRALVMANTIGAMDDPALKQMARAWREGHPVPETVYDPSLRQRRPDLAFLYDSVKALNPPRDGEPGGPVRHRSMTTEMLRGLTTPVQFIVGELDAMIPIDIMRHAASLIPGSRLAIVPGCGHSPYFEDAPAFNSIVGEFLAAAA